MQNEPDNFMQFPGFVSAVSDGATRVRPPPPESLARPVSASRPPPQISTFVGRKEKSEGDEADVS